MYPFTNVDRWTYESNILLNNVNLNVPEWYNCYFDWSTFVPFFMNTRKELLVVDTLALNIIEAIDGKPDLENLLESLARLGGKTGVAHFITEILGIKL